MADDLGIVKAEVENLKESVKELKEVTKQQAQDITELKENNLETKLYIKQIFEKIDEIKAMIKSKDEVKSERNFEWLKIIGTVIITVLGTFLFAKLGIK